MMKRLFLCLIAGFVFSIGDMGHVYSGMARYPHWQGMLLFNIPWWVPLEFAGAAFILIQSNPLLGKIFQISAPVSFGVRGVLLSFLWTLLIYLATSFIPESHSLLKDDVLFSALILQVIWSGLFSLGSLLKILIVALAGCGFEFFLGKMEVFSYFPSPSLIGTIPLWLACIYGSVAVTIRLFCSL